MTISFRWLLAALLALASLSCLAQAAVVPEAPPVLVFGGVGMVAARPLAEITGATIAAQGKTITLTRDTHRFTVTVGSTAATQDGKKLTLPLKPFQHLGVTYVPVTAFITFLGGTATESYTDIPGDNMLQVTVPGRDSFTLATQQQYCSPEELQQQTVNIYLANGDGSRVQQLTYDIHSQASQGIRSAVFAADGKTIIYEKSFNVVQRRLDALAPTKTIATNDGKMYSTAPAACPDGSLLLLRIDMTNASSMQDANNVKPQLCHISADGTECKELVTGAFFPVVSADGKTIAYTDITDQTKPLIHVMNADGTNNRALFPGAPRALSPDGKTLIAIRLEGEGENMSMANTLSEVTVSDGTVRFNDLPSGIFSQQPTCAFSPDGKRVVYQQGVKGRPGVNAHTVNGVARGEEPPVADNRVAVDGIWVMNADHTGKRKLTDKQDGVPLFSPDGSQIAFRRDGELYLMRDDGTQVKALTPGMVVVTFAFSPDGKQLLFSGVPKEALTPKQPAQRRPASISRPPRPR